MFSSLGPGTEIGLLDPWYAEQYAAAVDRAREALAPWVPFPHFVTDVDSARAHLQRFADGRAKDSMFYFGIWQEGELVGGVQVFGLDAKLGVCEIGVWLLPEAQGHGLATRAVRYVIDWAIRVRGLSRVQWTNNPANLSSSALARRLGMTLEGRLRSAGVLNGVRFDNEVWSIIAPDWPTPSGLEQIEGGPPPALGLEQPQ
jgi:ribosomal-protein-serine acetyltransferase